MNESLWDLIKPLLVVAFFIFALLFGGFFLEGQQNLAALRQVDPDLAENLTWFSAGAIEVGPRGVTVQVEDADE